MTILRCAFGTPWLDHDPCLLCAAETQRLCDAFAEDVKNGIYDEAGFTKAERRAQHKKVKG